jgi:hypothetical protein
MDEKYHLGLLHLGDTDYNGHLHLDETDDLLHLGETDDFHLLVGEIRRPTWPLSQMRQISMDFTYYNGGLLNQGETD